MSKRKKRKIKKKFIFIFIFVILIICLFISPYIIFNIRLIGDSEVIVNYGDKYSESGYRLNVFGNDLTSDVKVKDNIKSELGSYEVRYSYKFLFYDLYKIRKVEVKDIKGPKIELVGGNSVDVVINEEYKELGYSAVDLVDGDMTDKVKVEGSVDTATLGKYKVTYTVSDKSKNKTKEIRTVNVLRKNPRLMDISEYSLDGWYDDIKLKETDNKGDEYFNSLVMVGDSNMKNMYEYGLIQKGNDWAIPCLHAESMHYTNLNIYGTGQSMTLVDAVKIYKPSKLILNFGSFSSLWISEDVLISQASSMIEKIQKESPETQIVLISIYPVTKDGINSDHFEQGSINRCNFSLLELANKYKLKFLDVQTVLKDSSGYGNPSYYISDGFHLTANGHRVVIDYIKTHAF